MSKLKMKKDKSAKSVGHLISAQVGEAFINRFKEECDKTGARYIPVIVRDLASVMVINFPTFDDLPQKDKGSKNVRSQIGASHTRLASPPEHMMLLYDAQRNSMPTQIYLRHYTHLLNQHLIALRSAICGCEYNITTLRLEYCGITTLKDISELLTASSSVRDLSLSGNPIRTIDFTAILTANNLAVLSLCSCQLSEQQLRTIAQNLEQTTQKLVALNLSSNGIDDNGLTPVVRALRANRTLKYLNLADNCVTNAGCLQFIEILSKFQLDSEEIVYRRKRIIIRLRSKAAMEKYFKSLSRSEGRGQARRSIATLSGSKSSTRRSLSSGKSRKSLSSYNSSQQFELTLTESNIRKIIDEELGTDTHAFVAESYSEGGHIWCRGNFAILRLNLSYNKITSKAIPHLLALFEYQISQQPQRIDINLDGNEISSEDLELLRWSFGVQCLPTMSASDSTTVASKSKSAQMNI